MCRTARSCPGVSPAAPGRTRSDLAARASRSRGNGRCASPPPPRPRAPEKAPKSVVLPRHGPVDIMRAESRSSFPYGGSVSACRRWLPNGCGSVAGGGAARRWSAGAGGSRGRACPRRARQERPIPPAILDHHDPGLAAEESPEVRRQPGLTAGDDDQSGRRLSGGADAGRRRGWRSLAADITHAAGHSGALRQCAAPFARPRSAEPAAAAPLRAARAASRR